METLIAQYLEQGYLIECYDVTQIEFVKSVGVALLSWTRTVDASLRFPFVGRFGTHRRVVGHERAKINGRRCVSYFDLVNQICEDADVDMSDIL